MIKIFKIIEDSHQCVDVMMSLLSFKLVHLLRITHSLCNKYDVCNALALFHIFIVITWCCCFTASVHFMELSQSCFLFECAGLPVIIIIDNALPPRYSHSFLPPEQVRINNSTHNWISICQDPLMHIVHILNFSLNLTLHCNRHTQLPSSNHSFAQTTTQQEAI